MRGFSGSFPDAPGDCALTRPSDLAPSLLSTCAKLEAVTFGTTALEALGTTVGPVVETLELTAMAGTFCALDDEEWRLRG